MRLEVLVNRAPGCYAPPQVWVASAGEQWWPVPSLEPMAPAWVALVEAVRLHPPVRAALEQAVAQGIDLGKLNGREFSPAIVLVAANRSA